jgi:hypothetical protein
VLQCIPTQHNNKGKKRKKIMRSTRGKNQFVRKKMWYVYIYTMQYYSAILFSIAKLWKQSRCPTTDEWIKKMWYLYTMEFYAAMKKNEMLSFAGK